MEGIIVFATYVVGTLFLLSQEGASNLVQAAVSMVFINEIDNAFFSALNSAYLVEIFNAQLFIIPGLISGDKNMAFAGDTPLDKKTMNEWSLNAQAALFFLQLQVPIFIALVCTALFAIRSQCPL